MKSEFFRPLLLSQVSERDWRVEVDFLYFSESLNRKISVAQHFITDLASVPRLPFVYWICAGVCARGATIHDWIYRDGADVHLVTRKQADKVFKEVMLLLGYWRWRAWLMYFGLRLFGWASWRANHATSGMGNCRAKAMEMYHNSSKDRFGSTFTRRTKQMRKITLSAPMPHPSALASARNPLAKHRETK